jgi:hypothetical protein
MIQCFLKPLSPTIKMSLPISLSCSNEHPIPWSHQGKKGRCGRAGEDYQVWHRVDEKSSKRQKFFEAMR